MRLPFGTEFVFIFVARLVGGTRPAVGRLEVYHNGVWGTVCDDQFTNVAAGVACYNIGYGWVSTLSQFVCPLYINGIGHIIKNHCSSARWVCVGDL